MTTKAKNRAFLGGLIVAIVAMAATLLPMLASSDAIEPREIHLVVREMTFYVDGSPEPNPSIVLRAGERVKVVVRNEDAGMRHDFAIREWTVATRTLDDRGEQDAVTFRVPDQPGDYTYTCTPHSRMMSGTIRVE